MESGNNPFALLTDDTLRNLEIDVIIELLRPIMRGLFILTPIIPQGSYFYRARVVNKSFNKENGISRENLIYPPVQSSTIGRANRPGSPMFYCSLSKEPIFYEIPGIEAGTELIISFWRSNRDMLVNNVGYTQFLFQRLGAGRAFPSWAGNEKNNQFEMRLNNAVFPDNVQEILSLDRNREVREQMSQAFMRIVAPESNHIYRLSAAIAELHLMRLISDNDEQFAGILYPSIRTNADSDNLALIPDFVDKHLDFVKCLHTRIERREDRIIQFTNIDYANEFSNNGQLQWLGRLPRWQLLNEDEQINFSVVEGTDHEGDYQLNKNGNRVHQEVRDNMTGNIILPS